MIRIDALRTLVTVAETGSLRDAAVRLGRTQSALSMTLKQLEATLGGPLFEADRKRDLTDLGHFVRSVAEDLLLGHDVAIDRIQRYAAGRSGRLRIISVPSVAALILPHVLRGFLRDRPGTEIDLMDSDSDAIRAAVASGRADLGFASAPQEPGEIEAMPLFDDQLLCVCRADSALGSKAGPLHWADLGDAPPLILNETLRGIAAPKFVDLLKRSRLSVRNTVSLTAMVEAGIGITILPGLATKNLPRTLVARAIADCSDVRRVSLLSRAGRAPNPLSQSFCRHLHAELPDHARRFDLLLAHAGGQ